MRQLYPWEIFVRRWVGGPSLLAVLAGLLLAGWSLAARYFGIPPLVEGISDGELGLAIFAAGLLALMAVNRLTCPKSGLLVPDCPIPLPSPQQAPASEAHGPDPDHTTLLSPGQAERARALRGETGPVLPPAPPLPPAPESPH